MNKQLTFFDFFSGIGGFRIGLERAGFKCVGYCDNDKHANKLYSNYFNTEEECFFNDITTINTAELPDFDILCGGFPCQSFSIAGKRRGFEDTRGTMFFEVARILKDKKPKYFILENVKGFRNKNNKFSWDWYELWQDAHKKSFTVAKAMREDILKDIRSALEKALTEGKTFREFSKELKPTLQKKGWWGEQIVVDSQGVAEKVQLGSMYRLKTIYSVNMQTAYQTGRYKTQYENVDNRPYWEYVAVMDASTRPEHAMLNGLVYRYDDPFWQSFYPPNGWRCRCRVNALSDYNLQKKNRTVSSSSGTLSEELALVSKKSGEYKPVTVYTDPLTGKRVAPDVGWSHNPASGLIEGD